MGRTNDHKFIDRRMPKAKPSYTNYDQTERRDRYVPAPVTLPRLRFMGELPEHDRDDRPPGRPIAGRSTG